MLYLRFQWVMYVTGRRDLIHHNIGRQRTE